MHNYDSFPLIQTYKFNHLYNHSPTYKLSSSDVVFTCVSSSQFSQRLSKELEAIFGFFPPFFKCCLCIQGAFNKFSSRLERMFSRVLVGPEVPRVKLIVLDSGG